MSTLVGHFVSSPREREKRDRRRDEREEQERKRNRNESEEQKKIEMCQYDTDAPCPGPSSPTCRHFAKNEVEKRAITLIIIGRFYPKSNVTYIL